ncbi:MAG: hypothetical protein KDD34_08280, partial [Bdellovibrionales bacterium]|nr:hypothetical protein [Bdellovibrionales bacterium]
SKLGLKLKRISHDFEDGGTNDGKRTRLEGQFDYFRTLKKTDGHFLFYSAGLLYIDDSTDYDNSSAELTKDVLAIPIAIGLETQVKEWLSLRGSVTQNVILDKEDDKSAAGVNDDKNNMDDTTVAAGAGIVFGDLKFDAVFEGSTTGDLNTTTLLSRVGMNYSF